MQTILQNVPDEALSFPTREKKPQTHRSALTQILVLGWLETPRRVPVPPETAAILGIQVSRQALEQR